MKTSAFVVFLLVSIAVEVTGSAIYGYGVKQCAFKSPSPNENKQNGQIQTCDFQKTYSNSALRVTFHGGLRLVSCSDCCRRWYITINGKECSSPAPIDALIYTYGVSNFNLHRPGTLDGFCNNIPAGRVAVGLSVGKCNKYPNVGYVNTCWNSVCRLIIEEVPLMQ